MNHMPNNNNLALLFTDKELANRIKAKLPNLFQIAEIESSRAGKIGMEVGSAREKVVIALLIYKFGADNVNTNIPITEPETDVIVGNKHISIKTITGNGGVKAVWTVDAESAKNFIDNYEPKCDIILVNIFWGQEKGGIYLIPLDVQKDILKEMGKSAYLNLPKAGTNPRGVEFSKEAIKNMLSAKNTLCISINWKKQEIKHNIYEKWVEYWKED